MIDSQAVKTIEQGAHYDAGQKIKARQGHLLVDRLGLIEAYQSKLRTDLIQMVLSAKWGPPKVALRPLD